MVWGSFPGYSYSQRIAGNKCPARHLGIWNWEWEWKWVIGVFPKFYSQEKLWTVQAETQWLLFFLVRSLKYRIFANTWFSIAVDSSWSCSSACTGTPRWAQPPTTCRISAKLLIKKNHIHLRAVLLLLRLKSVVYLITPLKTGTRSKMNRNPASSAASEWLCFYSRWRTEELLIHFLNFEVCLLNK